MNLDTPHRLARHLVKYVTDDTAIRAHVKRDFGVIMPLEAIHKLRSAEKDRRLDGRPLYVSSGKAMEAAADNDSPALTRLAVKEADRKFLRALRQAGAR